LVITNLIGGLGNQLFQYALGRALSLSNGAPLKFDISGFESYKLRRYSLSHFNVAGETATAGEVERFRRAGSNRLARLGSRLGVLPGSLRFTTVVERGFQFQPEVLRARGNVYLDGYWQSEKYFKQIEDIIRTDFTLRSDPDPAGAKVSAAIAESNSVSIHVRRGDYATNPEIKKIHGLCSPDYYRAAIDELTKTVTAPHFFVFSDDPDWCRENLRTEHAVTFVSDNKSLKDYEELWLMSLCKHHIIANSSFSWWGAWLGRHPGKMVFAPKTWFRTRERDTSDLIPDAWYMI
jgi:hypothetical protein